ncbi:MAG: SDR family oxidoreductase [Gemmatimonadetes bacterium]|nr:SDR family oxidoreductase [Gemmatimonadota bacterium]
MQRVALVTGGSRGIGAAIVDRLAATGYVVYFSYLQNHEAADDMTKRAGRRGQRVVARQHNNRDADDVAAFADEVLSTEGRIDVLVANAASTVFRPYAHATDKHWRWTFDVNVRAFLALTQRVLPHMEARGGGHIVVISSAGARRAIPSYSLLGASKAALESLVRHLALEFAGRRIVINSVVPGLVETEGVQVFTDEASRRLVRQRTPAGRLTSPEDVAGVVAFLCSPDASMIHGQTVVVDGGYAIVG